MYRKNSPSIKALTAAVFAALFGVSSAMAAVPVTGDKVGSLITVKTGASFPSIASDAAGDSAVVWDVPGGKIVVQRYNADGNPVGARFQANTTLTGNNVGSKIAMDAAGDFVVVWTGDRGTATSNVFAQLFDKTGTKVGTEFQVNVTAGTAFPNSTEHFPASVAMDATGNFVVVWTGVDAGDSVTPDAGIFAQRFDKTGAAQTNADIAVNATTTGRQVSPAIAMSASGAYVIAWTGVDAGDSITPDAGIFAQLYDNTGTVTKAEFAVNADTTGAETLPAVGMDLTGEFVVAWSSHAATANNTDVHAQRFDNKGAPVDGEFLVNAAALGNQTDGTAGVQSDSTVAMDVNGDFVIGWDSQLDDTNALGDYANFYAADGSLKGGTKVEALTDTGFSPAASVDAGGDSFIAATITTNAVSGIFGQRFAGFNPLDLSATLNTTALTTVKPGDAITLTASITNNAAAGTPTGIAGIDSALSTATTVQAGLTLPSGTSVSSTSGTGWTCPTTPTTNVLTCTFAGGLAAGVTSSTLTLNLVASDTGGVNSFTHDASGLQPDADAANNEASLGVDVDHAPVASDGVLTVNEDSTNNAGTLVATDADSDALTFTKVSDPAHGAVTVNADGSFSYTPAASFSGSDSFTFKANDGNFYSNDGTVNITVTHVNHAPVATAGTLKVNRDTAKTGTLIATDADSDSLTFSVVQAAAHGTVTPQTDGSFSYKPAKGFSGSDSFTFKANDGTVDSNVATISVTVVEHAPVGVSQTFSMIHNTVHKGTLKALDGDAGDTHTFSKAVLPKHGTLQLVASTGAFSYTPNKGFIGKDSFVFKVSDGAKSDDATVNITVK